MGYFMLKNHILLFISKQNIFFSFFSSKSHYYRFLVAWNAIKMRCSNTFLCLLKKIIPNSGQLSITALVLSNMWLKECLVLVQYWKITSILSFMQYTRVFSEFLKKIWFGALKCTFKILNNQFLLYLSKHVVFSTCPNKYKCTYIVYRITGFKREF